jgi:N utilization substance protein B
MNPRRLAREGALRVLYEVEVGGSPAADAFARMIDEDRVSGDAADFSKKLVDGILDVRANLDANIAGYVREYDYSRLAAIDRNILRIGAYELLFIPDLPPAVTIDEAIELAKKFSTAESGKFVNGVLERIRKDSAKATWTPTPGEEARPRRKKSNEEPSETTKSRTGKWTLRTDSDDVAP